MAKRIDGIYLQAKKILAEPENRRRIGLGAIILTITGLAIFFFLTGFPFFRAEATIKQVEPGEVKDAAVSSDEIDSQVRETPTFILDAGGLIKTKEKKFALGELDLDQVKITARLWRQDQESEVKPEISTISGDNDQFQIKIPDKSSQFAPGKYTLKVDLETSSKNQTLSQDFLWGVLAINLDKSTYKVNEAANIGIGVLDDMGRTVCDAKVWLKIFDPNQQSVELSTENKTIVISDTCANGNITNIPDYFTSYSPAINGNYQIELKAETANGLRSVSESFEVLENPDFVIKRQDTSMRIYPPATYAVNIEVLANKDLSGGIKEKVPASFEISKISNGGQIIDKNEITQTITWPASLAVGENIKLSYEYDAPDISPQFYLLGPLEIWQETTKIFIEPRAWQIAADLVGTIRPNGDSTPLQWTPTPSGTHYTTLTAAGDLVTQPTAPDIANYVNNGGSAANLEQFAMDTISGIASATQIDVWVYGNCTTKNSVMSVDLYYNGSIQNLGTVTFGAASTWSWQSVSFTGLSLDQTALDGLEINISGDAGGRTYTVAAFYANVTYTAAAIISIGGTVYDETEGAVITSGPLVRAKVQGDATVYSANANGSGVYNIASVPTATVGKALTVYLDTAGAGPYGATFTVTTGSSMANIHIYQNRISTRCDNSCSLTNANINQWDKSDDTDIHAASDGTNLVVDNDWKLRVSTNTFAPAGTVTMSTGGGSGYSGDVEIKSGATLNMAANALSISGNYTNGGTATLSSNTTSFTKTSGTQTLISGGTGAGYLFNNLTHSGAGTLELSTNALQISGNLVHSAGVFQLSTLSITVTGTSSITGTLDDNSNTGTNLFVGLITINASGSWTSTGNSAYEIRGGITNGQTFTGGTGTYTFTTNSQNISGGSAMTFGGAVAISGAITITNQNTSTVTITGNLDGNNASSTWTNSTNSILSLGGSVFATNGVLTATANPNTVNYTASGGGQTVKGTTYHILTVQNTSGTDTAGNTITVNSGLTTTSGGTLAMSTYQLLGAFTPTNNGTITTSSTADPAIPTGKTWTGTTGIVQFAASAGGQYAPAGTYKTLIFSNTSNTDTARGIISVSTALTTTSGGTLAMDTYQLQGAFTPTNNGTITTSSTADPAIPTGQNWTGTDGLVQFAATGGGQFVPAGTYKTLTFSNSSNTDTARGALSITTLNTTAGGTVDLATYALTVTTPNNAGTIRTQNTSATPIPTGLTWGGTIQYDSTIAGQTVVNGTYNNLTIAKTAQTATLGGAIILNGDLAITSGILDTSGTSYSITIAGNWNNSGTFTPNAGTVDFNKASSSQTLTSGGVGAGKFFNNLTHSGAGTLQIITNDLDIDGNFDNSNVSGTFDANGRNISIKGTYNNTGIFTAGASTVTFDATTGTITLAGTMTGASAFNSVIINDATGDAIFRPTANITINADFTLTDGILDLDTNDPTVLLGDDSGTGNVNINGGSITASNSANFILNDNPTEYYNVGGIVLGNVVIGQSPAVTNLKSDMSAASLTLLTGDTLNTHGWDVTISGYLDCQGSCVFDTHNYAPNNPLDSTIVTVGGDYTMSATGTFVIDNGPTYYTKNIFNGTAAQIWATGGKTYSQVQLNNTGIVNSDIVVSGDTDINNTFDITDGVFKLDTNDPNLNLAGDVSIASAGSWTKQDNGSSTVTFDGSSTTFADAASGGLQDIGLVTIGPSTTTTLTTNSNMKLTDITIGADDVLDISSDTLYVGGNYVNSNTLTATGSTVDFTKSSSTQTLTSGGTGAGKLFNNLTHSGAGTLQLITNSINIDGVFENSSGTFDANDLNINVADDFLISGGSFSADIAPGATTQTVTFDGTNEATVSGSNTFYNLTMNTTTDGAKTIKFTASTFQTINNTWTLDGDIGKVLTLRSTVNDTAWEFVIPADINPAGDYIDVRDSQNNTNVYRIYAGANTTNSGNNVPGWIFNTAPNPPFDLTQKNDSDVDILELDWTNSNTPKLGFTITDPNTGDTVKYEIQVATDSGFLSLELDYTHGSLEASGTTFEFIVGSYGGGSCSGACPATLADSATGYWWRVKAIDNGALESSYVEFGVAGTMDFKVDATAPTGLIVYDGNELYVDHDYSGTALNSLAANWTVVNFNISGPATPYKYQYAIGTTVGGVEILDWTSTNTDGAVVTANGLIVNTSIMYFWTVKATDLAGNISTVSSNGQRIEPTISFSFDTPTVTFALGTPTWTESKDTIITTQTNAQNGYNVQAYILQLLTQLTPPYDEISNWTGTYLVPAPWAGNCVDNSQCGFGYTSSDPDITTGSRGNMYNNGLNYCAYAKPPEAPPGDVVADNDGPTIDGSRNLVNQPFTLTHKVAVDQNQTAGQYQTTLRLIVTANY